VIPRRIAFIDCEVVHDGDSHAMTLAGDFIMFRYVRFALFATALILPYGVQAQNHDDQARHDDVDHRDADHRDEHHWDAHEDAAYRRYLQERHMKYREFEKLNKKEQDQYWAWRHDHPDEERR